MVTAQTIFGPVPLGDEFAPEPVTFDGFDGVEFVSHFTVSGAQKPVRYAFSVTEATTGFAVVTGQETRERAVEQARLILLGKGTRKLASAMKRAAKFNRKAQGVSR